MLFYIFAYSLKRLVKKAKERVVGGIGILKNYY